MNWIIRFGMGAIVVDLIFLHIGVMNHRMLILPLGYCAIICSLLLIREGILINEK